MKIIFKTSTPLKKHLPPSAKNNEASVTLGDGSTVLDSMNKLGFSAEENYLITLNGSIVTPSQRTETVLHEGDKLTILPPLKGG